MWGDKQPSGNFPQSQPGRGMGAEGLSRSILYLSVLVAAATGLLAVAGAGVAPASRAMRPTVTLKIALDQAGGVDDAGEKDSGRFTSEASLDAVHRLRRDCQAVVVGVQTVIRDDPTLTVRRVPLGESARQPMRVVLDRSLRVARLAPRPKLLTDGHDTVVFFASGADQGGAEGLLSPTLPSSARLVPLEKTEAGMLHPEAVLDWLGANGVKHVLLEGGPCTARLFLDAGCVNRAIIIRAPIAFADPVPSGIDEKVLASAGLSLRGRTEWGCDEVECWTQHGQDWPGAGIGMWP
jgi:riboflavin-specific deaminase-like protein